VGFAVTFADEAGGGAGSEIASLLKKAFWAGDIVVFVAVVFSSA